MIKNSDGIWILEGEQLWDSEVLNVALQHINRGDTVIDAGAWIGGHTMSYAQMVGERGRVFAFEPNPDAFHCLVGNTLLFPNVHCYPEALGDKEETVSFSAKKGWYDSGYVGDDQKIADVEMKPLDDHRLAPNFIKIDVEGCELKVLKGATKMIEKHRPKMVIEINKPALSRQGSTFEDVFGWIYEKEYEFQIVEDQPTGDIYNILCIPR